MEEKDKKIEAGLEKEIPMKEIKGVSKEPLAVEAERKPEEKQEKPIKKEEVEKKQAVEFKPAPQPRATAPTQDIEKKVKELKLLDEENQLEILKEMVSEKGVEEAIEIARKLNNAFVLDELHKCLTGEMREKLFKDAKLKEL